MLKDIRQQRGLTQQTLADMAGINIRQLQKYELGECDAGNMTLRISLSIADALGVDVRELLPDADQDRPQ